MTFPSTVTSPVSRDIDIDLSRLGSSPFDIDLLELEDEARKRVQDVLNASPPPLFPDLYGTLKIGDIVWLSRGKMAKSVDFLQLMVMNNNQDHKVLMDKNNRKIIYHISPKSASLDGTRLTLYIPQKGKFTESHSVDFFGIHALIKFPRARS